MCWWKPYSPQNTCCLLVSQTKNKPSVVYILWALSFSPQINAETHLTTWKTWGSSWTGPVLFGPESWDSFIGLWTLTRQILSLFGLIWSTVRAGCIVSPRHQGLVRCLSEWVRLQPSLKTRVRSLEPHGGRREVTSAYCSLIATCVLWYTCVHTQWLYTIMCGKTWQLTHPG